MNNKKINTVQDYFDVQPVLVQAALLTLKSCIVQVVPTTKALLNYNIPAYTLVEHGKREQQVMIAGYKSHVGFYPHPTTIEKFKDELKEYKTGKGSVQFPLNKPLPVDLIERMIQYRLSLLIG